MKNKNKSKKKCRPEKNQIKNQAKTWEPNKKIIKIGTAQGGRGSIGGRPGGNPNFDDFFIWFPGFGLIFYLIFFWAAFFLRFFFVFMTF